jgi:hypothetical protein
MNKRCSKCKIEKDISNFYFRNNKAISQCKECVKKRVKKYSEENREIIVQKKKEYSKINKNRLTEYKKKYYQKNKKHLSELHKKYRSMNKSSIQIIQKEWNRNNREKYLLTQRKYQKNKRQEINYKIKSSISRNLSRSLNKHNNLSEDIIGYKISILKEHLEKQFDENMNWENYGSYWQIDHIIPTSLYDFIDKNETLKCWNYRNLRPLERSENARKRNLFSMELIEEYNIQDLLPKHYLYQI